MVGQSHFKIFSGPRSFLRLLWLSTVIIKILVGHGHFQVFMVGHSHFTIFGGPRSFFRLVWLGSHSKDFCGPRSFSGFCGWTVISKFLMEHSRFMVFWVGHSHSKDFGGPGSFSGFCGWAKSFQNFWWDTVISRSFGWDTVIITILVGQGHFQAFVVGQSHSKIFGGTRSIQGLLVGHNHSKVLMG